MIKTYEDKIVPVYGPIDATGATVASDIVSLKNYDHVTFIVEIGLCGAAAATSTNLALKKGKNVTTCATAMGKTTSFRYFINAAAHSGDTLSALTTFPIAGISIGDGNTYDFLGTGNALFVIEVDAADLEPTIADPWDTVRIGCVFDGEITLVSILAILSKGRYKSAAMPTAITD